MAVSLRRALLADAEAIAHVHLATWIAHFEPILTPEQVALKNLDEGDQIQVWKRRLVEEERRSRWTVVAESEKQKVVAYITSRINQTGIADFAVELHQIYVLPDAQRTGLGKRMVQHLAQLCEGTGHKSMLVWVMTINPAVAFYRDGLGGAYLAERIIPDGDGALKEIAYGWRDIRVLLKDEL